MADVRDAVSTHERRYLERIYTAGELADCAAPGGPDVERLAARFAAKEAAAKVLRPRDEALPWNTIEVERAAGGWTELRLHGAAAAMAEREGIEHLAVSLSHEHGLACAVVTADMRGSGG